MRKYPSDVSISKNFIDANFEMVERRDPDTFPRFPAQEWCAWTLHEIALKECALARKLILEYILKLKKCHFFSLRNILNCQAEYPLESYISVKKLNECLIEKHLPIYKFCSQN